MGRFCRGGVVVVDEGDEINNHTHYFDDYKAFVVFGKYGDVTVSATLPSQAWQYDGGCVFGLIGDKAMFSSTTFFNTERKDIRFSEGNADSIFLILGIK